MRDFDSTTVLQEHYRERCVSEQWVTVPGTLPGVIKLPQGFVLLLGLVPAMAEHHDNNNNNNNNNILACILLLGLISIIPLLKTIISCQLFFYMGEY